MSEPAFQQDAFQQDAFQTGGGPITCDADSTASVGFLDASGFLGVPISLDAESDFSIGSLNAEASLSGAPKARSKEPEYWVPLISERQHTIFCDADLVSSPAEIIATGEMVFEARGAVWSSEGAVQGTGDMLFQSDARSRLENGAMDGLGDLVQITDEELIIILESA